MRKESPWLFLTALTVIALMFAFIAWQALQINRAVGEIHQDLPGPGGRDDPRDPIYSGKIKKPESVEWMIEMKLISPESGLRPEPTDHIQFNLENVDVDSFKALSSSPDAATNEMLSIDIKEVVLFIDNDRNGYEANKDHNLTITLNDISPNKKRFIWSLRRGTTVVPLEPCGPKQKVKCKATGLPKQFFGALHKIKATDTAGNDVPDVLEVNWELKE